MCGIAGIWSKDINHLEDHEIVKKMVGAIQRRGPDFQNTAALDYAVLGHARLSILDISESSNQPMRDATSRYALVFNGEIYNFKKLREQLSKDYGLGFKTTGDTEILLYGLINEGADFILKLNGFFAFAFLDTKSGDMLLARDRYGIKPLYYQFNEGKLSFGSSLTAISKGLAEKEIDQESLAKYLQYSYIPAPSTILKGVLKLEPGHLIRCQAGDIKTEQYYQLPKTERSNHTDVVATFRSMLAQSVEDRLVSDVPLGTFLSGGYDSSVITLLAKRHLPDIPAFSIGFPEHPYFDESGKAAAIANHLKVEHHIVEVGEKKIDESLQNVLEAIDEPFADSSAVLMNILSQYTRSHVKVALSGDGADEIMGGYNKHRALLRSNNPSLMNALFKGFSSVFNHVPESRNSTVFNQLRKAKRYAHGLKLDYNERYDAWASFTTQSLVRDLLKASKPVAFPNHGLDGSDFNSVLKADMRLVLPNDMLHKVDLMSMYNSLEVRVPFLDHRLVNFLFSLPANQKLNSTGGKILLKKAFEKDFPPNFFNGAKKGFEAPLSHWLKGPLAPYREKYFNKSFVEEQGIFNFDAIKSLEKKSLSPYPGDTPHTMWALIVFQDWFKRHF